MVSSGGIPIWCGPNVLERVRNWQIVCCFAKPVLVLNFAQSSEFYYALLFLSFFHKWQIFADFKRAFCGRDHVNFSRASMFLTADI